MEPALGDPLLGRKFVSGQVEIQAPLGAGGMGQVYRGWHHGLKVPVAVKVMLPHPMQHELLKRLRFEAASLRRLNHPNAVKLLESGVDPVDGLFFMVMELIDGRDLARLVAGGKRLDVPRACGVMVQALAALQAAHALNLLHRDIKPGNIMLTRVRDPASPDVFVDQVKVVDFGLAKQTGSDATQLTNSGLAPGTPGFMAPEQALGEPLDARADVYACGVTLYRLLAGAMPFSGEPTAMVQKAMFQEPPLLDAVPPELARVIRWAMAKDRDQRCPSARALSDALAPFASGTALAPLDAGKEFQLAVPAAPPRASDRPTPVARPRAPALQTPSPGFEVNPPGLPQLALEPERPRVSWRVVVGVLLAVGTCVRLATAKSPEPAPVPAPAPRPAPVAAPAPPAIVLQSAAADGLLAAEDVLLAEAGRLKATPEAARLVSRVLQFERERFAPPVPFVASYRLQPGTWSGDLVWGSGGQPNAFTLRFDVVRAPFVAGVMEWPGAKVAIRGITVGNQVTFVETAPLGGVPSGAWRATGEKRTVYLDDQSLHGFDHSRRTTLTGLYLPPGPANGGSTSGREPLSAQTLSAYIAWRSRANDALEAKLTGTPSSAGTDPWLERCPLGSADQAAVNAVVGALFVFQFTDRLRVYRDPKPNLLLEARATYGDAFVDSVLSQEGQMLDVWSRAQRTEVAGP